MTPRLLIASPTFHGYYDAFKKAFDAVGFDTRVVLLDHFGTVKDKARNKIAFELPERFGRDTTAAKAAHTSIPVITALRAYKPDFVLVIKGDSLSDAWWDELERSKIPYVVWIYDEIRRMRYSKDRLLQFPKVATYSDEDFHELASAGAHTMHIANGFDSLLPYREIGQRTEVTFVGAAHENRKEIMQALHDSGENIRVYGREWSHDWRDRLRTWNRPRPHIPAHRDISRSDAYGVMKGSFAHINVHFNQDGFAMRTFEVPGVGGVQLIDRPDVARHYEVGKEVLVYESIPELTDLLGRLHAEPALVARIREAGKKRTLAEHTMIHRAEKMKAFINE